MIRSTILLLGCFFIIFGYVDFLSPQEYIKYVRSNFAPRYLYITNIVGFLSLICFLFGLSVRLIIIMAKYESMKIRCYNEKKMRSLKKHYTLMLPVLLSLNTTVTLSYWFFVFYDKESVVAKMPGTNYETNSFIKLCLHFFPFVVVLSESLFSHARFSISDVFVVISIMVSYYTLICGYYIKYHMWPYGIFNNKTYLAILLIIIACAAVGFMLSFMILEVYRLVTKKLSVTERNN